MRIPKGIDNALNNRKRNAEMINHRNTLVEHWLRNNKIVVSDEDLSGVQVLSDPQGSIDRIRAAILAKPVKKKIEKDDELMHIRRFLSYVFCELNAEVSTDDSCFVITIDNLEKFLYSFKDVCYCMLNKEIKKTGLKRYFAPDIPIKTNAYSDKVIVQYGKIDFESIGISYDVFQEIVEEYKKSV